MFYVDFFCRSFVVFTFLNTARKMEVRKSMRSLSVSSLEVTDVNGGRFYFWFFWGGTTVFVKFFSLQVQNRLFNCFGFGCGMKTERDPLIDRCGGENNEKKNDK